MAEENYRTLENECYHLRGESGRYFTDKEFDEELKSLKLTIREYREEGVITEEEESKLYVILDK